MMGQIQIKLTEIQKQIDESLAQLSEEERNKVLENSDISAEINAEINKINNLINEHKKNNVR